MEKIPNEYLKTVVFTSGTSIKAKALAYCKRLESVTIPNSVTSIERFAFIDCKQLTQIILPSNLTSIGDAAFMDTSITQITIPNSVVSMGMSVFNNCDKLTSITIGSDVTCIGKLAFYGCSALSDVFYFGTADKWNEITIEEENEPLTNATVYYYADTEPTESGNYWHYDTDGVTPVIWKKEST